MFSCLLLCLNAFREGQISKVDLFLICKQDEQEVDKIETNRLKKTLILDIHCHANTCNVQYV